VMKKYRELENDKIPRFSEAQDAADFKVLS
jgi:hypothetical protein